jgi:glycosyltransferase involved in cell wall biosynthesis
MKISILTICRNDLEGLRRTANSVVSQSSPPDEFIVLDGSSSDGTVDFLRSNTYVTEWKSEPDAGIADAFNKVTRMASGDWIIFLNSGDILSDPDVFRDARDMLLHCDSEVGVVYGNAQLVNGDVVVGKVIGDPLALNAGNSLCHQACFIRRELQLLHPYDVRLRIGMDYDLWLRLGQCTRFSRLDRTIARFSLGGVSSSKNWAEHSLIAHHCVRWLNSDYRSRLSWRDVLHLMVDLAKLRTKKAVELIVGDRLYSMLKKVFRR